MMFVPSPKVIAFVDALQDHSLLDGNSGVFGFSLEDKFYDVCIWPRRIVIDIIDTDEKAATGSHWRHSSSKFHLQNKAKAAERYGYTYISIFDWEDPTYYIPVLKAREDIVMSNIVAPRLHWYDGTDHQFDDGSQDWDTMISKGYQPIYDSGQYLVI